MRTLWRGFTRVIFWSFERGTWPYDLAVALIVVFVLLSPRSWFNDRPRVETAAMAVPAAMVELRGADPTDGASIYRVDARLIMASSDPSHSPTLEEQLRDVVRKHVKAPPDSGDFAILRVAPVRGHDGSIAYYDVCVKP